jgi:hypothetical protein
MGSQWGKYRVNRNYFAYAVLGCLYVVVKIAFVSFGYLHLGAIAHGSIPAVLTILACFLSVKEYRANSGKLFWHSAMFILPLLAFIITPIYMRLKAGNAWLDNGRLPVLIIYLCIATIQSIVAFMSMNEIKKVKHQ